eukprot:CAMPEP_0194396716 /NCGR_PEP_ID=MMETSP0174-20130528/125144_1 /TAXON_ID=216777 /ORGANISM="Proboscia alata, Strain PI-D3" /LENGTH=672 /DNA_ID=CAMNT_0039192815 /DNA_START=826 /DNA_END=2844 /DNA_ORIENTATION=+
MNNNSDTKTNHNNEQEPPSKPLVIIISGPTGVGKSAVAAMLCQPNRATQILSTRHPDALEGKQQQLDPKRKVENADDEAAGRTAVGHIVSADSVQVYKGLQIGANKPTQAELMETVHHLISIVNEEATASTSADAAALPYNANDWMEDALLVLQSLTNNKNNNSVTTSLPKTETSISSAKQKRQEYILQSIKHSFSSSPTLSMESKFNTTSILPVVVGGSMMYLQWLVHGRPDAPKPSSPQTVQRAEDMLNRYRNDSTQYRKVDNKSGTGTSSQTKHDGGWSAAAQHVSSFGSIYADRVSKLFGINDWYRLRRILEVALTATESTKFRSDSPETVAADAASNSNVFTGERRGGLLPHESNKDDNTTIIGTNQTNMEDLYDTRCFFLCPTSRLSHSHILDQRCEEMLIRGLLKETTDLRLTGKALLDSDTAVKSIGYRQALDYLARPTNDVPSTSNSEGISTDVTKEHTALQQFIHAFKGVTRRYSKKQMQWFRRDDAFLFIPVEMPPEGKVHKKFQTKQQQRCDTKNINRTKDDVLEVLAVSPHLPYNGKKCLQAAADTIEKLCQLSRHDFEQELSLQALQTRTSSLSGTSDNNKNKNDSNNNKGGMTLSAQTKYNNELQGKDMRFFMPRNHILGKGGSGSNISNNSDDNSEEYNRLFEEAMECTCRMREET